MDSTEFPTPMDSTDARPGRSHYEVLGVEPEAPLAAIKAAYHRLVLELHPDRSSGADGADSDAPADA